MSPGAANLLPWLLWDFLLQARTYYSTILIIATSLEASRSFQQYYASLDLPTDSALPNKHSPTPTSNGDSNGAPTNGVASPTKSKRKRKSKKSTQSIAVPSDIFSFVFTFAGCAYAGNLLTYWVLWCVTPTTLTSNRILPWFALCWLLVNKMPGVAKAMDFKIVRFPITFFVSMDSATTALNMVDRTAFRHSQSWVLPILAGIVCPISGLIIRRYEARILGARKIPPEISRVTMVRVFVTAILYPLVGYTDFAYAAIVWVNMLIVLSQVYLVPAVLALWNFGASFLRSKRKIA